MTKPTYRCGECAIALQVGGWNQPRPDDYLVCSFTCLDQWITGWELVGVVVHDIVNPESLGGFRHGVCWAYPGKGSAVQAVVWPVLRGHLV